MTQPMPEFLSQLLSIIIRDLFNDNTASNDWVIVNNVWNEWAMKQWMP
jgi:hypothetical protein